jgi:hypothetical protein
MLLVPMVAHADLADELESYVGYTIVAVKTIAGYVDEKKGKKDDFEGCDSGRKIFFSDDTYLACSSYGYQYAYRPQALILSNGSRIVMLVDSDSYDIRRQ